MWAFWVSTDSGDHYGPFAFSREPTNDELETFLRSEFPDEFVVDGDGPGEFGSYAFVNNAGYVRVWPMRER